MTSPPPQLTVLILAGGRSTRMGLDKAWLDCGGMPLVERVARRLLPVADEILFSTNDPAPYADLACRLEVPARPIPDRFPAAGPLAGLHAGLCEARGEWVFAVATDMPFVAVALVRRLAQLAAGHDAVVPLLPAGPSGMPEPEPLHAVYRLTCREAVEGRLRHGQRRVVSFLPDVDVRYVPADEVRLLDPDLLSFTNINTPADWALAAGRMRREGG